MISRRFARLFRPLAALLAIVGVLLALVAPGWGLALIFAALFAYVWRFSPQSMPAAVPAGQSSTRPLLDTYRSIEWKGMIFRSHSEVRIAKTLDHRGIFFIPPTRVRLSAAKDSRQSRELDFVICHEGKWGVLEVDGPFHDRKLDAERDGWLRRHGITSIQRFPAEKCYNTPHAVIDEFLHALEHS